MRDSHNLMGNTALPNYLKYSAIAILLVTYFSVLAYAGVCLFNNKELPTWAAVVIGSGLTIALNIIGQHATASLAQQAPQTGLQQAVNDVAITALHKDGTGNQGS